MTDLNGTANDPKYILGQHAEAIRGLKDEVSSIDTKLDELLAAFNRFQGVKGTALAIGGAVSFAVSAGVAWFTAR